MWPFAQHRVSRWVAIVAVLGTSAATWAADRFVSVAGSDAANDCLAVATPCRTLAHGVAQASSGDVIKATSGRYQEHLYFEASVTLTLSGSWAPDFSSRDATTYGSKVYGSINVFSGLGETLDITVDGFTITRDPGVVGGGFRAVSSDDGVLLLRVLSCAVRRSSWGSVLALSSETSSLTLEIADSVFSANRVRLFPYLAGIALDAGGSSDITFSMSDSTVERTIGDDGFGAHGIIAGGVVDVSISRSRIERHKGRGLILSGAVSADLEDVNIVRNRGGISQSGGTVTLTNSVVAKNTRFGGIRVNPVGGSLSIVNSTIRGNSDSCFNDVLEPDCSGGVGIASGSVDITNAIIWGNRNGRGGGGDFASQSITVNVDHSDVGETTGTYNDLGGNISADPLFATRQDPHLTATSPAIDTGTCVGAPPTDFEGDPRPTGGGCDMGADEFVP